MRENAIGLSGDQAPLLPRSLPGRSMQGSGTWTEEAVQKHIVSMNVGNLQATQTLLTTIRDLATDPEFTHNLPIAPTPTNAGLGRSAVLRQHAVDRADIEARCEVRSSARPRRTASRPVLRPGPLRRGPHAVGGPGWEIETR